MLAIAKWSLLATIVNSLLLCTLAIERSPAHAHVGNVASQTASAHQQATQTTRNVRESTAYTAPHTTHLKQASLLNTAPAVTVAPAADSQRNARNLYAPFNTFSKLDEAPFTDWHRRADGTVVQTFGAYRSGRALAAVAQQPQMQMHNAAAQRRSDVITTVEVIPAPGIELSSSTNNAAAGNVPITIPKQVVPDANAAATAPVAAPVIVNATRSSRQRNYVYIPLQQQATSTTLLPKRNNSSFGYLGPPAHAVAAAVQEFGEELLNARTDRSDLATAPAPGAPITSTDKADFDDEDPARRNGFKFPSYSLKPASPFYPQGYREDNPIFTEATGFEAPYSEDALAQDTRHTRQLIYENSDATPISHPFEFPGLVSNNKPHTLSSAIAAGKLFREEVTKFGDVNGPITAVPQRPQRGLFFGDTEFRTGPPRPFVPQKAFNEYVGPNGPVDYQSSRKSRFFPFKSSRSPRVVFPVNDNIGTTGPSGTGNGVYFSDSVAFRDQNFGLNDLAAIQDVRNEFSLQDIDGTSESSLTGAPSSGTFKEKVDITTELECQHRGGTCEFFLGCWMSGGLLQGTCNGLLRGCCHRTAKSANLRTSDFVGNTIDLTDLPHKNYGPVKNDASCGISLAKQAAQRRIVGGDDAGFGSFPWQAYIRIGSSRCGGSLVSRRHVVTAGHCVARATPRQVHVTLGDYVINSAVEPLPAYTFGVRRIDVHPYFKFTPQADRFDVSVLTLERPVHFMPHIAPICLPEKNEDFLGKFGWAAGWGALNPGSRLRPKTLQAVDVPVIENRICERWHRQNGINVVIYPEMMCAGYRNGGKDSCQGDSGGPLMHEKNGRWYLIGVVSAGYSCASRGQPGIYHRVPYTVDWISYVVGLTTNV
ncbi:serine proteinase stubble [Bactrocera neohumeralis]|uniref:serine proteinase stubble n=1 Tax=Bactrocera neohumeralis TaxID=98809 RepID=UPI0021650B77|nr:serine proteinase stubble [Bactrocera neohumeralis]